MTLAKDNRDTQKHCGDLNESKIRVYEGKFQSMFTITDFYHLMNQKLETKFSVRFGDVRSKVPQSRVTIDLSMHISDLGQAHRNFLVAPQWQVNDKLADGQLLCEASSDQGLL